MGENHRVTWLSEHKVKYYVYNMPPFVKEIEIRINKLKQELDLCERKKNDTSGI